MYIFMDHLMIYHIGDGICITSEQGLGAVVGDTESYRTSGYLI